MACTKRRETSKSKSVLSEAVHYDHIHLLQNSVLHRIVEEKWKAYGRRHAVVEATMAAMHLILITASIGLRPTTGGISTIMLYVLLPRSILYSRFTGATRPSTAPHSINCMQMCRYNSNETIFETQKNYGRAVCDALVLGFTIYMAYNEMMGWCVRLVWGRDVVPISSTPC